MRKLFIAGNWKMNLDRAKSVELVRGLADAFRTTTNVDVAVALPQFTSAKSQGLYKEARSDSELKTSTANPMERLPVN